MPATEKILWVVNYNDADQFLETAVRARVTGVAIRTDNNILNALPRFHDNGLKVFGWRWPSAMRDPAMREADKVATLLQQGMDGYYVDPEGASGQPYDWDQSELNALADDFCRTVTSAADGKPFGTTSHYRASSTFSQLPWAAFFRHTTVFLPQSYWRSDEGVIGHGDPRDNYERGIEARAETGATREAIVPMAGEIAHANAAEIDEYAATAEEHGIESLHFYTSEENIDQSVWSDCQSLKNTDAYMSWRDLLASANDTQTLTRARSCLGRNTVYLLGGSDNDPAAPFPHQCDCSGFVDWSIGTWRQLPPHSDKWLYTDSIWEGGGEVGHGLFAQVSAPQAQPGDFYVYPSPAPHHVGHISIIVEVNGGAPSRIIHCASSNYHNTNDAVRITAPTIFTQNQHARIMRPNYDALRVVGGITAQVLGTETGGSSGSEGAGSSFVSASAAPASATTAFSIDTNLKTTRSPLTAARLRAFFEHQTEGRDALKEIGEPAMQAQERYGINATYIVAHAILESGWGRSVIARNKHNLYGWEAFDEDPGQAKTFANNAECIDFVMGRVNKLYLTPGGRYYDTGPVLGNKTYGMNKNYAAEADWGTDIASIARRLEREA